VANRILPDPMVSKIFRLSDPTVGNPRIQHPTTSGQNPVLRKRTISDRILLEVVGFLSEVTGLLRISDRIRRYPSLGFFALGKKPYRDEPVDIWSAGIILAVMLTGGKFIIKSFLYFIFFLNSHGMKHLKKIMHMKVGQLVN